MNLLKRSDVLHRLVAAIGLTCALIACGGGGSGGSVADVPPVLPAWQTAQFLETSNALAVEPDVAINASGVGYAVWQQPEGVKDVVFSSRYRDGAWEPAQRVSGVIEGRARQPEVIVLPDGEALSVWRESFPATNTMGVKFSRTVGGVWQEAGFVQGSTGADVLRLKMVADAKGNAVAAWLQREAATPDVLHAAVFRNGVFEPAQPISVDFVVNDVESHDVAIDDDGNALAVWSQLNGNTDSTTIFARPYVEGVWKAVEVLNPTETQDSSLPRVAVGSNGAASVVWVKGNNKVIELTRATNFVQGAWDGAVKAVSTTSSRVFRPQATLDSAGVATVIWVEEDGAPGSARSLVSSRPSLAGSDVQKVETDDADVPGSDEPFQMGLDANGRVMTVWPQSDGTGLRRVLSNRHDPVTGKWGSPESIEKERQVDAFGVSLAMSPAGRALVVWGQEAEAGGNTNIMANVFK